MKPTVLAFLVLAACSDARATKAEERAKLAESEASEARKDAEAVAAQVDRLARDLDELGKRVDQSLAAIDAAHTDVEIAAARAKLLELQKAKADMDARVGITRANAAKVRTKPAASLTQQCRDNPLAKGCS